MFLGEGVKGEEAENCISGDAPGSLGEVNATEATVVDHPIDGAFGDQ